MPLVIDVNSTSTTVATCTLPPETSLNRPAACCSNPECSTVPIITNSPMKNTITVQLTFLTASSGSCPENRIAAAPPAMATKSSPMCSDWAVAKPTMVRPSRIADRQNTRRSGTIAHSSNSATASARAPAVAGSARSSVR